MESYEILWNKALIELEKTVSSIAFSTYVQSLQAIDLDGGVLILQAPTRMYASFLSKLSDKISDALEKAAGVLEYKIYVQGSEKPFISSHKDEEDISTPIDPKYTFDSFVVGSSNRYLYAASKAVSEDPGNSYNPLFIYGSSGLGKTHIMHAIANEIKHKKPKLNVIYATCEKFTNDLINSIRQGKGHTSGQDFRNRYRTVDVLIIDDVQFLAKKQSTQEEFFHTFNELYSKNKQIILSSDCHPREIELLEDRLKTRFSSGLMAEVLPPDLETKIAILQKKAEEKKYILNLEVATFLAEQGEDDVRSLEGILNKVIFASLLKGSNITIDLAKEALALSKQDDEAEVITADHIISSVCSFYKISKSDLLGKRKTKELVEPRQICTYLMTELLSIPLMSIASAMGRRDHTTVIYTRDKISELIKTNERIATQVQDLKNLIRKK